MIAEGADVEVCLAIGQNVTAAGLVEDVGSEVDQVLRPPVAEELGEGANPGNIVRLLLL
jgi:hypothetical protein